MQIFEKLRSNKKLAALLVGSVLLTFVIPYITIPALLIWLFYKKSKLSKKVKVLISAGVGGLIIVLGIGFAFAYANDVEPHLKVAEPASTSAIKAQQVIIKGTYDPTDRKVWINGKDIKATSGVFESIYQLKEGENKIDISTGNWKRTHVYLTVTRELTDEEKISRLTPSPTASPTVIPQKTGSNLSSTPIPTVTIKPTSKPSPIAKPTNKPVSTALEKINSLTAQKYPDFELTVWNKNSEFASEGQVPYEVVLNGLFNKAIVSDCSVAKRLAYDMVVTFYNDTEIRPTLSRILITIPNYLRMSLGASDGIPMAEKGLLGGINGPTNFWNTMEQLGPGENENGDLKDRTWGNYLTRCEK